MAAIETQTAGGFDFHRQKPIDRYIVDFFSHELMLAVEIDGTSHKLKRPEDETRQKKLEMLGIRFLRFDDHLVKRNLDAVVRAIDAWIELNRPHLKSTHPGLRPPLFIEGTSAAKD